jgi:hypothetical protein
MARKITKEIVPNDLREPYNRRDDKKLTSPQKTTIIIENETHCSLECPQLHNYFNVTYGCNLCIEEVGSSHRRYERCKRIFGN